MSWISRTFGNGNSQAADKRRQDQYPRSNAARPEAYRDNYSAQVPPQPAYQAYQPQVIEISRPGGGGDRLIPPEAKRDKQKQVQNKVKEGVSEFRRLHNETNKDYRRYRVKAKTYLAQDREVDAMAQVNKALKCQADMMSLERQMENLEDMGRNIRKAQTWQDVGKVMKEVIALSPDQINLMELHELVNEQKDQMNEMEENQRLIDDIDLERNTETNGERERMVRAMMSELRAEVAGNLAGPAATQPNVAQPQAANPNLLAQLS